MAGYWDTHDKEREELIAKIKTVSETAESWMDIVRVTKETKEALQYFCRKYKISTPNMVHGGHNRRKYEVSGSIGRSIESAGYTYSQE